MKQDSTWLVLCLKSVVIAKLILIIFVGQKNATVQNNLSNQLWNAKLRQYI
jgi:hypothetical protein